MNIHNHIALDCPCTAKCERHGDCAACVAHHHAKGNLPYCLRAIGKQERKKARRKRKAAD